MKKKYYLLFILCLILMPFNEVKGAAYCGFRYLVSSSSMVKFYEYGGIGYCGPDGKALYNARGGGKIGTASYRFSEAACDSGECIYYYTKTGVDKLVKSQCQTVKNGSRFPTNSTSNPAPRCVKLYYDPSAKYSNFTEVTDEAGNCLHNKKTNITKKYDKGFKYATDSLGYEKLDISACQNASSSGGGYYLSCTSSYMQSGCNTEEEKSLKSKLKTIGEKNSISSCSSLTVNTSYDNATVSCVKEYQTFKNLSSDGIVSSKTLTAVNGDYKVISEELAKQAVKDKASVYYAVTFDTAGGHFANGESTRIVYFSTYETVMYPGTPGKTGYKFLGWYNGNDKYSFDSKPSNGLTLTAKWETVDTSLYCLNDNDVLDVDTGQCITVETFEKNSNNTEDKFYIVTPGVLQTITTKSKFKRYCNNNVYALVADYKEYEGSNNTVQCGTDLNYVRDFWRAEDTCQVGSFCDSESQVQEDCSRVWRGTCYATYDAADASFMGSDDSEDNDNAGGNGDYSDDNTGGKPSQEEIDKNKDNDVSSNPNTGNVLIFIAWTIGLGALGYSIYWFQKRREEL